MPRRFAQAECDVLKAHVFVVRLWQEESERADTANTWRGSLRSVETKELLYFRSFADLAAELSLRSGFPYPDL
jgi:hypothetical protein